MRRPFSVSRRKSPIASLLRRKFISKLWRNRIRKCRTRSRSRLPVQPPTIIRKESVAGPFTGPQFDANKSMPENWKRGRGKFNATISTSPWLPKIAGVPVILDYPHGCFEQISTKLLGYSFLANLLAYLPDIDARDAEYRSDARARHETIQRFAAR